MLWRDIVTVWAPVAVVIGAFMFARKYGGGAALEQLERAALVRERRITELERAKSQLESEVAVLHARTDVTVAISPVLEAVHSHDERATRLLSAMLHVLDMIAGRLGAEPNGDPH